MTGDPPEDDPVESWSGRRDSNPRPTAWKAVTLPLSYSRPVFAKSTRQAGRQVERVKEMQMVEVDGFEPP